MAVVEVLVLAVQLYYSASAHFWWTLLCRGIKYVPLILPSVSEWLETDLVLLRFVLSPTIIDCLGKLNCGEFVLEEYGGMPQ